MIVLGEKVGDETVALAKLSNGIEIPQKAISTAMANNLLHNAIWRGHRHFYEEIRDENDEKIDAVEYPLAKEPHGNIGKAIRMYKQPKISRKDIYITVNFKRPVSEVKVMDDYLDQTFKKIDTDYFDVLLLDANVVRKDGVLQMDLLKDFWSRLEDLFQDRLVHAIGVSNFTVEELQQLLLNSTIYPVVLKTDYFPISINDELIDFCQSKSIQIMADYPFLDYSFFDIHGIETIAKKYKVNNSQLMNQYAEQRGIIPIMKKYWEVDVRQHGDLIFKIRPSDMKKLEEVGNYTDPTWSPLKDPDIHLIFQQRAIDHDRLERSGKNQYTGFPPIL